MINQIFAVFEVSAFVLDCDNVGHRKDFYIFGQDTAIQRALEIGRCDNVMSVDVIDIYSGEAILVIEKGVVTWSLEKMRT